MDRQPTRAPLYGAQNAGILYSAVCVVPIVLSTVVILLLSAAGIEANAEANWYRYLSYFLPQLSFALCLIVMLRVRKPQTKPTFYVKAKPSFWAIALLLSLGTLFGLSQLNTWFIKALESIGLKQDAVVVPTMYGWGEYLLSLFVIAVLPAVMEETVFRGLILGGLKEGGTAVSVLLSGALFSLFHQNPAQTPYQFVCGCLFALLAVRSHSILVPVCMHFVNNAFILSATFFGMPALPLAVTLPIGLCALVGGTLWLIFSGKNQPKTGSLKPFYLAASVGILYSAVAWIVNAVV